LVFNFHWKKSDQFSAGKRAEKVVPINRRPNTTRTKYGGSRSQQT